MPHGETVAGLYEFWEGDMYATVDVVSSGNGWVSEWWISRNIIGTSVLQVLGYVRLPIFGNSKDQAVHRLHFIYEDLMSAVGYAASQSESITGAGGDVVGARVHCRAHLVYWAEKFSSASRTEHTAALYSFAVEFGVNNPAALIAQVEVLPSVRTVHDRIAYARRIGLLDSYGQGRIKLTHNQDKEEETYDINTEEPFAEPIISETDAGTRIIRFSSGD